MLGYRRLGLCQKIHLQDICTCRPSYRELSPTKPHGQLNYLLGLSKLTAVTIRVCGNNSRQRGAEDYSNGRREINANRNKECPFKSVRRWISEWRGGLIDGLGRLGGYLAAGRFIVMSENANTVRKGLSVLAGRGASRRL